MTKGSPVRLLLAFAAPLLVANIFQQLYTVVDAVVLGRGVGVRALAAAGSTGSVHFLVFGFITGLTHGYSILISQKFGAGSAAGVRRAVANSAYIAVLSSAVITVLSDRLSPRKRDVLHFIMTLIVLVISVVLCIQGGTLAAATTRMTSPALKIPMACINISITFCGIGMVLSSINTLLELAGKKSQASEKGEIAS